MSNHLISTVYKRDLRTPMRKSVMALLADKASDDGAGIYASKQTMADELCCSKQTIIDTIKGFLAEGLLVELGTRAVAQGHVVEYGISVDVLEAIPLVACHAKREQQRSASLTGQPAGPVKRADRSTTQTPPVKQVDPNPPGTILSSPEASPPPKKRTRKADPFPMPEWAEEGHWQDFLENRKRKGLANTASAYRRFESDIARLTDADWPPGRLLQHAAERGWGGIYDPRGQRHGQRPDHHRAEADYHSLGRTGAAADRAFGSDR